MVKIRKLHVAHFAAINLQLLWKGYVITITPLWFILGALMKHTQLANSAHIVVYMNVHFVNI